MDAASSASLPLLPERKSLTGRMNTALNCPYSRYLRYRFHNENSVSLVLAYSFLFCSAHGHWNKR